MRRFCSSEKRLADAKAAPEWERPTVRIGAVQRTDAICLCADPIIGAWRINEWAFAVRRTYDMCRRICGRGPWAIGRVVPELGVSLTQQVYGKTLEAFIPLATGECEDRTSDQFWSLENAEHGVFWGHDGEALSAEWQGRALRELHDLADYLYYLEEIEEDGIFRSWVDEDPEWQDKENYHVLPF